MELEEVGRMFKNDPTFEYIFNLPKSMFMKIAEIRRKRLETEPSLSDML